LSCLDVARRSRAIFSVAQIVGAVMSSAFLAERIGSAGPDVVR
jgi:hypothetical protein